MLECKQYIRKSLHPVFCGNNIQTANKARSEERIYGVSRDIPLGNPFDFTSLLLLLQFQMEMLRQQ